MKHKSSQQTLIIKLDDGEDVHESLVRICDENDIRMG
jgi:predicted DNA-binding protein with PD1-like motif